MKRYRISVLCDVIRVGQLLKVLVPCKLNHQISRCLELMTSVLNLVQSQSLQVSPGAPSL